MNRFANKGKYSKSNVNSLKRHSEKYISRMISATLKTEVLQDSDLLYDLPFQFGV